MKIHELKVWPSFFDAVLSGEKTFELRRNDRGYQKGDILHLREFDYKKISSVDRHKYTKRELYADVSYVLGGTAPFPGAPNLGDWVILSIINIREET